MPSAVINMRNEWAWRRDAPAVFFNYMQIVQILASAANKMQLINLATACNANVATATRAKVANAFALIAFNLFSAHRVSWGILQRFTAFWVQVYSICDSHAALNTQGKSCFACPANL